MSKLKSFFGLIPVVMLLDMRTRFGSSYFSFIVQIAWPLSHMTIITVLYYLRTLVSPVGDSATTFIATGVVPYILCLYPARTLCMSVTQNRYLLNIPRIQPIHLISGRFVLDILNIIIVLSLYWFALEIFGFDIYPFYYETAAEATAAAIFLGAGLGVLNVVLQGLLGRFYIVIFTITMIGLYITAGVYIPMTAMPPSIREYAVYNPILNLVEWMRSAYYLSYDVDTVNKRLVIGIAACSLTLGLLGERYLRGKIIS